MIEDEATAFRAWPFFGLSRRSKTPQPLKTLVDEHVRIFTDWFDEYDCEVEEARDRGQPLVYEHKHVAGKERKREDREDSDEDEDNDSEEIDENEYVTITEWAGEVPALVLSASVAGRKLSAARNRREEYILERKIREKFADLVVTTCVLGENVSLTGEDLTDEEADYALALTNRFNRLLAAGYR